MKANARGRLRRAAFGVLAGAAFCLTSGCLVFGATAFADSRIVLQPTPEAPAGATGFAAIEQGHGRRALIVTTQCLTPGLYALRVVAASPRTLVFSAMILISDPTVAPDLEANDQKHEPHTAHSSIMLRTRTEVFLPPALSAADIAEVDLTSPSGACTLRGKPDEAGGPVPTRR